MTGREPRSRRFQRLRPSTRGSLLTPSCRFTCDQRMSTCGTRSRSKLFLVTLLRTPHPPQFLFILCQWFKNKIDYNNNFFFIQNNKSTTVTTKNILIFILNSKCYRKTILKKYTTLKTILVQIQILQFQI